MATATPSQRSSRSLATAQPTKRMSLSDAATVGKKLPSRVMFHGQAGIGKTSFAAWAPSPLFLLTPGETGLHTLIDSGLLPPVPSIEVPAWDDLMGLIAELTETDHSHKTLVLDVVDGAEKLGNAHVCAVAYNNDWSESGFEGYQRGYRTMANTVWRELLAALDKLREVKRLGIILLAHTGVGNFNNPEGHDYNRWLPTMNKEAWQLTLGWADMVLMGKREVVTTKDRADRKAKGAGVDERVIITEWSAVADAKNRHNLPPEISMGSSGKEAWANFIAAIKTGREGANNA